MTTAFIKNNAILDWFESYVPALIDNGRTLVSPGASVGWIVTVGADVYALVSATLDTAPGDGYTATGTDYGASTVNAGPPVTASIKRTWQAVTPQVPDTITRTQGLLALLYGGISADPEAAIATAIAGVSDATQRTVLTIKFKADSWLVSDLVSNCTLLGMTPDQVKALAVAALAY